MMNTVFEDKVYADRSINDQFVLNMMNIMMKNNIVDGIDDQDITDVLVAVVRRDERTKNFLIDDYEFFERLSKFAVDDRTFDNDFYNILFTA